MECEEAYGEVINIGGTEEISISELAERIKSLIGSKSEIIYIPYEKVYGKDFEDMMRRVPSSEKLKSLIDFVPQTPFNTILEKTAEYFRSII
jgi:UDP-glucose 4-epimerase